MPLSLERANGHHRLHPQQGAGLGAQCLLRALLQRAHGARTELLRLELAGGLRAALRPFINDIGKNGSSGARDAVSSTNPKYASGGDHPLCS